MFRPDLLKGKRALVTGGGTGLGKSMGRRYLELGADLVICGRRAEVLEATARELAEATGGRVATFPLDVRDAAAVGEMLDRAWADGPIDILCNNAAGNFIAQTEKLSPRAIDSVLDIVLHGSFYCTVACGQRWIAEGRRGTVLSVVTTPAWTGQAFTVPSAAAKAGVLAMTRSLAVEWGKHGIRLVAVAPGWFPTPGAWSRLYPAETQTEPQERQVPLARLGDHHEFADLCAFLVSEAAGYITGECVVIDGGRWLHGAGGAASRAMLDWGDDQWAEIRNRAKSAAP